MADKDLHDLYTSISSRLEKTIVQAARKYAPYSGKSECSYLTPEDLEQEGRKLLYIMLKGIEEGNIEDLEMKFKRAVFWLLNYVARDIRRAKARYTRGRGSHSYREFSFDIMTEDEKIEVSDVTLQPHSLELVQILECILESLDPEEAILFHERVNTNSRSWDLYEKKSQMVKGLCKRDYPSIEIHAEVLGISKSSAKRLMQRVQEKVAKVLQSSGMEEVIPKTILQSLGRG